MFLFAFVCAVFVQQLSFAVMYWYVCYPRLWRIKKTCTNIKIIVWEHLDGVLLLIVNIWCLHAVGCVAVGIAFVLFGNYVCLLATFVLHKRKPA